MTEDIDPADGRAETADEKADRNWGEILQELRVIQTGTQILSGFLLAVAFQQRFSEVRGRDLVVYAGLVGLAALSTGLGLAIVALHRASFRHHDKPAVVTVASRLLAATVGAVAVLAIGVVLLIFDVVFGPLPGLVAAATATVVIAVLVLALPRAVRGRRSASHGA